MKNKLLFIAVAAILFASCAPEQNEDIVKQPEKDGSIEIVNSTTHIDKQHDLLTIRYNVWVKGKIVSSCSNVDTIPSLGTTKEQADVDSTDENGEEIYKTLIVPKDYQIFITVK